MIFVSLKCQMGNQLFQYAFGVAIAKKLHSIWFPFLNSSYYPFKLEYFELDPFTRFLFANQKIAHFYTRVCRNVIRRVPIKQITDLEWQPLSQLQNCCYYDGFFQSEKYFEIYDAIIKKRFRIKKHYQYAFKEKYEHFFSNNKIIVIHIRRTDYTVAEYESLGGPGVALPTSYYFKALQNIQNVQEYAIIFVGDDLTSIQKDFGHIANARFEKNDPIIDFQLIQHADISIIANSTFAWWAAYLTQNENSRIIAPEYWLGYKLKKTYPAGIRTDKFEWLAF